MPPPPIRSASFLARMCSSDSPASGPNLVQQNACGSGSQPGRCISIHQSMDAGRRLSELMRRRHLTQLDVATAAQVSQATVSRVLHRSPKRTGLAYRGLCIYIQQQLEVDGDGPEDVFDAVRGIWDGSERHAAALSELIVASRRLWPELAGRPEDRTSTAQPNSD